MNTIRDVIALALKKLTVIRGNGQPTANDAADALASLQSLYHEMISNGTLGSVRNVVVDREHSGAALPGSHYSVTTDEAVSIELPAVVPYWWFCNWDSRRDYGWGLNVPLNSGVSVPRDLSVVSITDQFGPSRSTYIYDGTIQRWVRVDDLSIEADSAVMNREAPISQRNPDGMASLLAMRLADQFGQELLSPLTIQAANKFKTALVCRYDSDDRECGHYGY